MNILYCTDDNYAMITGVSIVSLLENQPSREDIHIHVIIDNVSDENKQRLLSLGEKYRCQITLHQMPDWNDWLSVKIDVQKWSLSAFSRLFVSRVLPDEHDRILYLDCDIMVADSIASFYNTDLNGYWAAAVQDCLTIFKQHAGFGDDERYYNSGVLLLNLDEMQRSGVENLFAQYISERNGNVPYADQTVINAVMKGHIKEMHPRYNVMTPLFVYPYRNMSLMNDYSNYYSDSEIKEAVQHPALVHFTNGCYVGRPWQERCEHPLLHKFLHYKDISPWKDEKLATFNFSWWSRIKQQKNHSALIIKIVKMLKR